MVGNGTWRLVEVPLVRVHLVMMVVGMVDEKLARGRLVDDGCRIV